MGKTVLPLRGGEIPLPPNLLSNFLVRICIRFNKGKEETEETRKEAKRNLNREVKQEKELLDIL